MHIDTLEPSSLGQEFWCITSAIGIVAAISTTSVQKHVRILYFVSSVKAGSNILVYY